MGDQHVSGLGELTTPDGRCFFVKGWLWRCSSPALIEDNRQRLVNLLMDARRAVKAAKVSGDPNRRTPSALAAASLSASAKTSAKAGLHTGRVHR